MRRAAPSPSVLCCVVFALAVGSATTMAGCYNGLTGCLENGEWPSERQLCSGWFRCGPYCDSLRGSSFYVCEDGRIQISPESDECYRPDGGAGPAMTDAASDADIGLRDVDGDATPGVVDADAPAPVVDADTDAEAPPTDAAGP